MHCNPSKESYESHVKHRNQHICYLSVRIPGGKKGTIYQCEVLQEALTAIIRSSLSPGLSLPARVQIHQHARLINTISKILATVLSSRAEPDHSFMDG